MSAFPTAAKRRHFEPYKPADSASASADGEGEEEDERIQPIHTSHSLHPAGRLSGSSLVNAKIGLFERLSSGAAADQPVQRLLRQSDLDLGKSRDLFDADELHLRNHRLDEREELQLYEDEENEEEEEEDGEYLVLDTIVEEDEELLEANGEAKTTTSRSQLDCDNAAQNKWAGENPPPAELREGAKATPQPPVNRAPNEENNKTSGADRKQLPPVAGLTSEKAHDSICSSASIKAEDETQQTQNSNSHQLQNQSENNSPTNNMTNLTNQNSTSLQDFESLGPFSSLTSDTPLKEQQQQPKSLVNKTNNKMHHYHQTLLPSTNRLISEHQARQQQALFRALTERQKLLDELGPDERLEQSDLMSSSCLSLSNFLPNHSSPRRSRAKRHWRKQRRHNSEAPNDPDAPPSETRRRRSSSATALSRTTTRPSRSSGVPLSSVDLSSMTDQQVEELMGQIAPASSSSSLVSSTEGAAQARNSSAASLVGDFSSDASSSSTSCSSSSSSYSANEDFSSSSSSCSSNEDDQGDENQEGHQTSLMPSRRPRRQLVHGQGGSSNSDTQMAHNNHNHNHNSSQQLAPSVIGVHEDGSDSISVNSARKSFRNSRKCREAYKRRNGKGGRSDDDDEDQKDGSERDRRNQGDLYVSVSGGQANGSSQDEPHQSGRVNTSGQCSLSPMATSQTASSRHAQNQLLAMQRLNNQPPQQEHQSLGCSSPSTGLSVSQSPTTSDEPTSMALQHQQAASSAKQNGHSVEAILGRMLSALDEVGASEEQDQLNDLLERGFLHLEQLLNCSLAPSQQSATLPRSQPVASVQQQQSQKDSDYGSDTQSTGDCFSTSTTNSNHLEHLTLSGDANSGRENQRLADASGPESPTTLGETNKQAGSSLLSPLAIELSFKLAESLRRLAQQQQHAKVVKQQQQHHHHQHSRLQPESSATMTTSGTVSELKQSHQVASATSAAVKTTPGEASLQAAKTSRRMKSVVMLNSSPSVASSSAASSPRPLSAASGRLLNVSSRASTNLPAECEDGERNMTPGETSSSVTHQTSSPLPTNATATTNHDSRPGSQQSQRQQFKTRVNLNVSNSTTPEESQVQQENHQETQIVKVISSSASQTRGDFERQPRRSSFRREPSLRKRPSFSGQPRPGSPVPRSVLESTSGPLTPSPIAAIAMPSSRDKTETSKMQEQPQEPAASSKQQHQLQRALVLAQKYNYSPARLAASKLSSKLQLKELIQQPNGANYGGQSSSDLDGQVPAASKGDTLQQIPRNRFSTVSNGNYKEQPTSTFNVTGQVQLDISYFARTGSLTVHLLQCSQLLAANKRRATSNPYVKLYLLPDRSKSGKRKSAVKRRHLNPNFDERFTFGPLQLAEFDARILWLSVWHKDRGLSRNEFLGELYLPLSKVRQQLLTSDLCQSTSSQWYRLTSPTDHDNSTLERDHSNRANSSTLLTTKWPPQSNGHLSLSLARPQTTPKSTTSTSRVQQHQAAEMVAKKLSEFEMKAARLTQQSQLLLSSETSSDGAKGNNSKSSPPSGAQEQHEPRLLTTLDRHQQIQKAVQSSILSPPSFNSSSTSQTPRTMQVALGQLDRTSQPLVGGPISGQLFVALKFVPDTGELVARRVSAQLEGSLHVLIKEAKQIGGFNGLSSSSHAADGARHSNHLPSPFCKCLLLDSSGQKMAKQRTSQLKRTSSPRWDQELVFQKLKLAQLQAQAVEIQLFNRDSILVSASEHLGSIRLCRRLKHHAEQEAASEMREKAIAQSMNAPAQQQLSDGSSLRSSGSSSSAATLQAAADEDLCSQREARLWNQMLARPNIWVYGELPLRQLRPLVALSTNTMVSMTQ